MVKYLLLPSQNKRMEVIYGQEAEVVLLGDDDTDIGHNNEKKTDKYIIPCIDNKNKRKIDESVLKLVPDVLF